MGVGEGIDDITSLICQVGGIPAVGPDQDYYQAGVSSVAALKLVMELESTLGLTIPDEEFIAARTPRAVHELIRRLQQEQKA